MSIKVYLLIPLLFIFSISCKYSSDANEKKSGEIDYIHESKKIFPLSVGNYWKFIEKEYFNDSLLIERNFSYEILEKVVVAYNDKSVEFFKLKQIRSFPEYNSESIIYFLLRPEKEGIVLYAHSVDIDNKYYFNKHFLIKYPVENGEIWISDHGDYYDKFECVSTNALINFDNRIYDCIKIRMGDEFNYEDSYYCENIGLLEIRTTNGWNTKCNKRYIELSEYHVN